MKSMQQGKATAAVILAVAAALSAGTTILPARAAGGKDTQPAKQKPPEDLKWLPWKEFAKQKDGVIEMRFYTHTAGSGVWAWQFRSTFPYPVRVDYHISALDRRGRPQTRYATVNVPAKGQTDALSTAS